MKEGKCSQKAPHCSSVAATSTQSQPEARVKTQLAESFVVMPHMRPATRLAWLAAAS